MFHRRTLLASALASSLALARLGPKAAQARQENSLTLGMALEAPLLDPTVSAAGSAIGELVQLTTCLKPSPKSPPKARCCPCWPGALEVAPDLKPHLPPAPGCAISQRPAASPPTACSSALPAPPAAPAPTRTKPCSRSSRSPPKTRFTVVMESATATRPALSAGQATAIIVEPKALPPTPPPPSAPAPTACSNGKKAAA